MLADILGGIVIMCILCAFFMIGLHFEKYLNKQKQKICQHEYRLFRVCEKCGLQQKSKEQYTECDLQ